MKRSLILFGILLSGIVYFEGCDFFSGPSADKIRHEEGMLPESDRKYELKSMMIKLKSVKQILGSDIEITIYIDDYGDKYCNITDTKLKYRNTYIVTRSVSITKNDFTYTYNPEKTTGTKSKNKGNFNPMHIDFAKLDPQSMETNGISKEGESECLGRVCQVYVLDNPALDMNGRYEVWNKIPLKLFTRIGDSQMEMVATELEENAAIPAGVFDIPKEIEFMDAANPLTSPSAPGLSDSALNLPAVGK